MNYPAKYIVIYDGDCGVCSRSVRFLLRHDPQQRFKFSPIRSVFGRAVFQALGQNPDDPESFVAIVDGRAYLKSNAVLAVAIALGGAWKAAAIFKLIPLKIRDWLYGFVARHRNQIPGGAVSCLIDPSYKSRWILKTEPEELTEGNEGMRLH